MNNLILYKIHNFDKNIEILKCLYKSIEESAYIHIASKWEKYVDIYKIICDVIKNNQQYFDKFNYNDKHINMHITSWDSEITIHVKFDENHMKLTENGWDILDVLYEKIQGKYGADYYLGVIL